MTPEQVLAEPPRVLTQAQREFYFENGYIVVEELIDQATLDRLKAAMQMFVEKSRGEQRSGDIYDLAPGHTAERPMLRRLRRPDERHPAFWEFATGVIADVAADLVGPDVVFHHSKLNFKWADGADEVKWHQDIQFYPHTNYSPLTIGTYLTDVGMDDGPLSVIPGSHEGPLYDLYDDGGRWTGSLKDRDIAALDVSKAVVCPVKAGSISVHNCRTLHGTPASRTVDGRPLLLNAYSSADAFPYTAVPDRSVNALKVVRGRPARIAHHDPRACPIPPDWSGGYSSIFAAQAGEGEAA